MTTKIEKKMIAAFYRLSEQVPELKAKVAFYESIILDPTEAQRNDEFRIWDDLSEEIKQNWRNREEVSGGACRGSRI